jgi:hypothetical protein
MVFFNVVMMGVAELECRLLFLWSRHLPVNEASWVFGWARIVVATPDSLHHHLQGTWLALSVPPFASSLVLVANLVAELVILLRYLYGSRDP